MINFLIIFKEEELEIEKVHNFMRENCRKQANLTDAEYKTVLDHKLYNGNQTSKSLMCYALCYIMENNFYTNKGPNVEHLRKVLPIYINSKERAYESIEKCSKMTGADECERGYRFISCLTTEAGMKYWRYIGNKSASEF